MSTARQIDQTYVQTGQVRIVSKAFPVHGEQAAKMAEAALCAADQGRYWDYHDRLLETLYVGNLGALAPASLTRHATDLGLNLSAFSGCLESGKHAKQLEAERLGVTGTPAFFVNGRRFDGAYDAGSLVAALRAGASRAGSARPPARRPGR